MIRSLAVFEGVSFDPYHNLAVEESLMQSVPDGCCILYLWQNQNTVVIGRNQNAWKECRVTQLGEDGGLLARRLSGGGAVFHDLGNLNFTFLAPTKDFDTGRQTDVILETCRGLGIPALHNGRNDLTAAGKKFSGSAYYHHRGRSYHHGTLLVDADMEKLGRYLRPSAAKLRSKGVDSVRTRVANLTEFCPDLTVSSLKEALVCSFESVYGLASERLTEDMLDAKAVQTLWERNQSWSWNYGRRLPFDFSCEARFSWGGICLEMQIDNGVVRLVRAWSDAMDWELSSRVENALTGCRFTNDALTAALDAVGPTEEKEDIRAMLEAQIL